MKHKYMLFVSALVLAAAMATAQEPLQLTLSEAIRFATNHHPSLIAAAARIDEARARGLSLTSQFGWKASINGYATSGDGPQVFGSSVEPLNYMIVPDQSAAIANATIMLPFYTGGRDAAARSISSLLIAEAKAQAKVEELDLHLNVRLAFAAALLKEDVLQAELAGLQAATELERVAKEMFAVGKVAEAFALKAEAERAKAERRVSAATAERDAAVAAFKAAIGAKQSENVLPGDWDATETAPATLQEAIQSALNNRPELAAYRLKVRGLSAQFTLARRSYLPELNLMAMGDLVVTPSISDAAYKVGFVLSFPVVDAGKKRAEMREILAKAKEVEAEVEAVRLHIERQVAEAWATWAAVPAALKAAEAEAKAAEEAYRIIKLRYEAGRAVQAEVSLALADFVAALAAKAETLELQRRAWANLARSIGA